MVLADKKLIKEYGMEPITDWAKLWKELVEIKNYSRKNGMETPGNGDIWSSKARDFNERVKQRWDKPDSTRKFMLSLLEPNTTLVDIGAGTGAWAILFSKHIQKVTAVEPSGAMAEVMLENIAEAGCNNIEIIREKWPDADPGMHDYTFCSHAMYGAPDFPAFIQHMIDRTRKMCFLLIRAPSPDGLITEAAQYVWGQPHDSPNFSIAYNILLQMGIYANVQIEDSDKWFFITSPSQEAALEEIKSRLGLGQESIYNSCLESLLARRLIKENDHYLWPGGVQSALVYWKVS
jgi:SAM-dependent methyltransferase